MKSIVLLKIRPGQVTEVHNRLRQLQTVLECCTSFGCYDEAAIIQGESLEELWRILHLSDQTDLRRHRDVPVLDR